MRIQQLQYKHDDGRQCKQQCKYVNLQTFDFLQNFDSLHCIVVLTTHGREHVMASNVQTPCSLSPCYMIQNSPLTRTDPVLSVCNQAKHPTCYLFDNQSIFAGTQKNRLTGTFLLITHNLLLKNTAY